MIGIGWLGPLESFLDFRDLAAWCLDSLPETMRAVLQRVTRASVTGMSSLFSLVLLLVPNNNVYN